MLLNLHIKNFAIIDEVEIEFGKGFNVLTGETGAGKSILIGSITAALGAKVGKEAVGRNGEYALIELTFDTPKESILKILEEQGFFPEDGGFLVSKKIMAGGRSISKVNGETVTAAEVREIAMLLLNVHGQNEHTSLLKAGRQLELVDEFDYAASEKLKAEVAEKYEEYKKLKAEREGAVTDTDKRLREMDYLRFAIDEIEAANLKEGEDEELKARYKVLANARTILELVSEIKELTGDDEGSAAGIGRAVKLLTKAAQLDESLSGSLDALSDVESILSDFNRDICDYADNYGDSEEELSEVQARLDLIDKLKSKYGKSISDIYAHLDSARSELSKFEDYEAYLEKLERDYSKTEKQLDALCSKLSALRKKSSEALSKLIMGSMADLNFGQSKLEISLDEDGDFSANGRDSAEILVSLNPGEPMLPLGKAASGGELSRIMLAIKSVFAGVRDTDTLIFDEIDAGISGRTAQMAAEKLVRIAGSHQVICITHLPQIAAMADNHFVIEKSSDTASTKSVIRRLDEDEMISELARLTGGTEITASVLASAKEMKQLASDRKKNNIFSLEIK